MLSARLRQSLLLATVAVLPLMSVRAQGADSPTAAVEGFFKAVSDSNIKAMGMLFGTTKGPIASIKPEGWEKKLVIMTTWYVGVKVHALGESDGKDSNRRTVTTELSRGKCKVVISVVTEKSSQGWLVKEFSERALEVNRLCDGGSPGN